MLELELEDDMVVVVLRFVSSHSDGIRTADGLRVGKGEDDVVEVVLQEVSLSLLDKR